MIRIGICEDEKSQLEYVTQLVTEIGQRHNDKLLVDSYLDAQKLYFSYDDEFPYDLLILDIQMEKLNGMELARKLRSAGSDVKIIFLTGVRDYALEGYEVGAIRYLMKPLKADEFECLLIETCQQIESEKQEFFLVRAERQRRKVSWHEVLYMEAQGHYVLIHTKKEVLKVKDSLRAYENLLLEHQFSLCRRGLYVNLQYVECIRQEACVLDNGEKLPISKGQYRLLNDDFIMYYSGK